ncbi:MAG TPA: nucleoside-triphosphatase [Methanospirillum sp.]|nr:nucleoside-triphosphatase [Methanospirillum sp.]
MMIDINEYGKWHPPVYIISGEQGEGKTRFLMEILPDLMKHGIRMRGIVAPGYFQEGIRSGFSIIDVATGMSEDLSSGIPSPGCEQHGRFYFRTEGLSFGYKALLNRQLPDETDLLLIDEVGKFEMMGQVWSDSIDRLIMMPYPPMVWTVRRNLVEMVINRWQITRPVVVELSSVSHEALIDEILKEVWIFRSHGKRVSS